MGRLHSIPSNATMNQCMGGNLQEGAQAPRADCRPEQGSQPHRVPPGLQAVVAVAGLSVRSIPGSPGQAGHPGHSHLHTCNCTPLRSCTPATVQACNWGATAVAAGRCSAAFVGAAQRSMRGRGGGECLMVRHHPGRPCQHKACPTPVNEPAICDTQPGWPDAAVPACPAYCTSPKQALPGQLCSLITHTCCVASCRGCA